MNVGLCIHGLGLGGAQQIVKSIVSHNVDDRLRFFVYASLGGVRLSEVESAGATVRVLPRHFPRFDPLWVRALAARFVNDRIALVHTHLFGACLHGLLAARRVGGIPVVMTLHTEFERSGVLRRLGYRWIVPSRIHHGEEGCHEADPYMAAGVRRASEIIMIQNGIASPSCSPPDADGRRAVENEFGVKEGAPIVAAIGRLTEAKGFRHLISAVARLRLSVGSAPVLLLFGEGPLRRDLERQVRDEGVADVVKLVGYRNNIQQLLPLFDVVVFSSIWEGLPVALLEAMAAGCCIVGTRIPGIQQAVRDDQEALLARAGSVEELAGGLEKAITNPELRRRLGEAARERFVARFTAGRMVEQYHALYRDIVKSDSR